MLKRSLSAFCLVPVLALSACGGGGSSDSDKIKSLVNDVAKDPTTVCSKYVTADALKKLGGQANCLKEAKAAPKSGKAKVADIKVTGNNATAKITDKTGTSTSKFIKVGGDWKIDVTG